MISDLPQSEFLFAKKICLI